MAYRKPNSDWTKFLREHSGELLSCGVPREVFRERMRFFVFLDHGFDEWGWFKYRHGFFDARDLTEEQIERLATFVALHFGEEYGNAVSRWQRRGN